MTPASASILRALRLRTLRREALCAALIAAGSLGVRLTSVSVALGGGAANPRAEAVSQPHGFREMVVYRQLIVGS